MPFNIDAAYVDVATRYRHSVPICSLAAITGVDIARSRELARGPLATAPPRRRAAVPRSLSGAAPGRGERFLRHGRSAVRPLVESFADDGRAALGPDAPAGVPHELATFSPGRLEDHSATATTAGRGVHSSTSRVWAAVSCRPGRRSPTAASRCGGRDGPPRRPCRWRHPGAASSAIRAACEVATSRRPAGPARVRFELLWPEARRKGD